MTTTKEQKIEQCVERASLCEEMYRRYNPKKTIYSGEQKKSMQKLLNKKRKYEMKAKKIENDF